MCRSCLMMLRKFDMAMLSYRWPLLSLLDVPNRSLDFECHAVIGCRLDQLWHRCHPQAASLASPNCLALLDAVGKLCQFQLEARVTARRFLV